MMNYWQNKHAIKITHIPTGEVVIAESRRSQFDNRNMALKVLRSRLWAQQNGFKRPDLDAVIASYEFPDDVEAPNDLGDYREDMKHD